MKIFIAPLPKNSNYIYTCPRTRQIVKEGLAKIPSVEIVENETLSDFVIFDYVPHDGPNKYVKDELLKYNPRKLVVIDNSDENNVFYTDEYYRYFKRSIFETNTQTGTRHKIPLRDNSYPFDYCIMDGFLFPEQSKTIDVGVYLRPSCYLRAMTLWNMQQWSYLNSWKYNVYVGEVSQGSRSIEHDVFFDEIYFNMLAKTKIVISSSPWLWCSDSRGAEAIANKCVYMSNELWPAMPCPLIGCNSRQNLNGIEWVKFNPLWSKDLYDKLQDLLDHPKDIKNIGEMGYDAAMIYHTSLARMEYIIERL